MDEPSLSTDLVGTTATTTFVVDPSQTTNAFGEQETPPGRPAAADATPGESVRVLGTAPLLSHVEFTGRASIHGRIPPGTGLVGKRANVSHTSAATAGTRVRVRTEVVAVDDAEVTYDGGVRTVEDDRPVATAEVVLGLVDRDRFRTAIGADATAPDDGDSGSGGSDDGDSSAGGSGDGDEPVPDERG
jgi:predicted thioesterase